MQYSKDVKKKRKRKRHNCQSIFIMNYGTLLIGLADKEGFSSPRFNRGEPADFEAILLSYMRVEKQ